MSGWLHFLSATGTHVGSAAFRRSEPAEAGTTNIWLRPCRLRIGAAWLALAQVACLGCSEHAPPATVEGTLRLNGKPLDNCLVTFFPESGQDAKLTYSAGLTDRQGFFRLRTSTQQEGVAPGRHRVTLQDLSVSTGVYRRDHGTVDAEPIMEPNPPPPLRRSRVPEKYLPLTETPLSKEVHPGHQVIDLDIH